MEKSIFVLTMETPCLTYTIRIVDGMKKQKIHCEHFINDPIDSTVNDFELAKTLDFVAQLKKLPLEEQFELVNKRKLEFKGLAFWYQNDGLDTIYTDKEPEELEKQKTGINSNAILLPDLLRNPGDIKIIDSWLLAKEYIQLCEKPDMKGLYEWASKNENEDKEITDYKGEKTSGLSPRFQIAALGLWLYDMKRLSLKNNQYIGSKVGRAILGYYNMEIGKSDGSLLSAFQNKNKDKVNKYTSYFDGLDKLLPIIPKIIPAV